MYWLRYKLIYTVTLADGQEETRETKIEADNFHDAFNLAEKFISEAVVKDERVFTADFNALRREG